MSSPGNKSTLMIVPTGQSLSLYTLQSNLLRIWTEKQVDKYYQTTMLAYMDNLPDEEAKQEIIREHEKMLEHKSQHSRIKECMLRRDEILDTLEQLIDDQNRLEEACEMVDQLRKSNLKLCECILQMKETLEARGLNTSTICQGYSEIFRRLNDDNDFITDSVLGRYINFSKGYDPFFLVPYERIQKKGIPLGTPRCIEKLFKMNISYVYRLIKAKNELVQCLSSVVGEMQQEPASYYRRKRKPKPQKERSTIIEEEQDSESMQNYVSTSREIEIKPAVKPVDPKKKISGASKPNKQQENYIRLSQNKPDGESMDKDKSKSKQSLKLPRIENKSGQKGSKSNDKTVSGSRATIKKNIGVEGSSPKIIKTPGQLNKSEKSDEDQIDAYRRRIISKRLKNKQIRTTEYEQSEQGQQLERSNRVSRRRPYEEAENSRRKRSYRQKQQRSINSSGGSSLSSRQEPRYRVKQSITPRSKDYRVRQNSREDRVRRSSKPRNTDVSEEDSRSHRNLQGSYRVRHGGPVYKPVISTFKNESGVDVWQYGASDLKDSRVSGYNTSNLNTYSNPIVNSKYTATKTNQHPNKYANVGMEDVEESRGDGRRRVDQGVGNNRNYEVHKGRQLRYPTDSMRQQRHEERRGAPHRNYSNPKGQSEYSQDEQLRNNGDSRQNRGSNRQNTQEYTDSPQHQQQSKRYNNQQAQSQEESEEEHSQERKYRQLVEAKQRQLSNYNGMKHGNSNENQPSNSRGQGGQPSATNRGPQNHRGSQAINKQPVQDKGVPRNQQPTNGAGSQQNQVQRQGANNPANNRSNEQMRGTVQLQKQFKNAPRQEAKEPNKNQTRNQKNQSHYNPNKDRDMQGQRGGQKETQRQGQKQGRMEGQKQKQGPRPQKQAQKLLNNKGLIGTSNQESESQESDEDENRKSQTQNQRQYVPAIQQTASRDVGMQQKNTVERQQKSKRQQLKNGPNHIRDEKSIPKNSSQQINSPNVQQRSKNNSNPQPKEQQQQQQKQSPRKQNIPQNTGMSKEAPLPNNGPNKADNNQQKAQKSDNSKQQPASKQQETGKKGNMSNPKITEQNSIKQQQKANPATNNESPIMKNEPGADQANQKIQMKPAEQTLIELYKFIQQQNIQPANRAQFQVGPWKENIRNKHCYVTHFLVNAQLAAFGICTPLLDGDYQILYWGVIGAQKKGMFLFRKYVEYIEKFTELDQVSIGSGEYGDLGFSKSSNPNIFIKKRSAVQKKQIQFTPFLSYECSNICFKQDDKNHSIFFSEQIEEFKADTAQTCMELGLAECKDMSKLPSATKTYSKLKEMAQVNEILEKCEADTYAISSDIKVGEVNMIILMDSFTPKKGEFYVKNGYFCCKGTELLLNEATKQLIVRLPMDREGLLLYFSKKFPKIQEPLKLCNTKTQGPQKYFGFKMFTKQLYGRIKNPEFLAQGCYANWDIDFIWQDQLKGTVEKQMPPPSHLFGPESFCVSIWRMDKLLYGFTVNPNDFIS